MGPVRTAAYAAGARQEFYAHNCRRCVRAAETIFQRGDGTPNRRRSGRAEAVALAAGIEGDRFAGGGR